MTDSQTTSLARRLGPLDAAAIIVSNVIGAGILFTPPQVAASVPNPWLFLATWLAGGALAFAGAMAYAELAALRPHAGGEYVYLRAAYGPLAGFLTGWTSFVAGFTGAMAASAVVLVFYLDRFIPGVADATPFFVIPTALRTVDVLAADHGGHCRNCADGIGAPSRRGPRAAGQQRPRDPEGHRAARLHRPGVLDRRRIKREPAAERRQRDVDRRGCLRSSR